MSITLPLPAPAVLYTSPRSGTLPLASVPTTSTSPSDTCLHLFTSPSANRGSHTDCHVSLSCSCLHSISSFTASSNQPLHRHLTITSQPSLLYNLKLLWPQSDGFLRAIFPIYILFATASSAYSASLKTDEYRSERQPYCHTTKLLVDWTSSSTINFSVISYYQNGCPPPWPLVTARGSVARQPRCP